MSASDRHRKVVGALFVSPADVENRLRAENARLREALDRLLDARDRGMYSARETIESVEAAESLLATITGEHLTSEELEARAIQRYHERLSLRLAEAEATQ